MNFRTTWILLGLVLAGGIAWMIVTYNKATSERKLESAEETSSRPRYVFDPRPDAKDILAVELERPGKPTLRFERQVKKDKPDERTDWQMVKPLKAPVEAYMVNGLASGVVNLQYKRVLRPGTDLSLADAGLQNPRATIRLTDKDGKKYVVHVGRHVPLSNDTYIRVEGRDEILITSRNFDYDLKRKVNDYRSKSLFRNVARTDAKRITIEHGGKTYTLIKLDSKTWKITQPVVAYADAEKIRTWVNSFANLRAAEFIDDQPASLETYGLDKPYLTATLVTEREELEVPKKAETDTQPVEPKYKTVRHSYTLLVGAYADLEKKRRYIKLPDQPWVASADARMLERIEPKLDEWRDPRLIRVEADDIRRIEIRKRDRQVVLARQNDTWRAEAGVDVLDPQAVQSLVRSLTELEAADFIDQPEAPQTYGLDAPRAILRIQTATGERVELRLGKPTPSGRNVYAQLVGQPSVVVLTREAADAVAVGPLALRSKVILETGDLRPVLIERIRGPQRYVLRNEGAGRWVFDDPAGASTDPSAIRQLTSDLADLRAKAVVGRDDDARFGLDTPELLLRVTFEPRNATTAPATRPTSQPTTQPATRPARITHTLLVAHRDRRTFCRLEGQPYVFELDESLWRVLTDELIDRQLLDLDPAKVVGLKIAAPGGTLEFVRDEGVWKYKPDPFVKLSQKKVGDLVRDLAKLRVERYLAWRSADLTQPWIQNARVTVTLALEDGSKVTLRIEQDKPGELPKRAVWLEQATAFRLREGEARRLMRGLDAYLLEPEKTHGAEP